MKLLALIVFIFLAGCAKPIDGEVTHEFDQYLHDFNSDLMKLGYMPIDFSQTLIVRKTMSRDSIQAESEIRLQNKGSSVIYITERFGIGADYIDKMIIYHEIGHHFLGLRHSENDPKALMTNLGTASHIGPTEFETENSRLYLVSRMLKDSLYHALQF